MALTTNGWWLQVTLIDNGGNVTTKRYELRSADATAAAADSAAVLAALDAITDSVVSAYRYGEEFLESAFAYPAAGVENENKASITALLDTNGAKKANIKIPAPVIGIFQNPTGPGANIVDVLDAALVTYGDLFKTGNECYISDGEDLDSLVSGKRISAKSNNG